MKEVKNMRQLLSSENLPLTQKKHLHKDFLENERLYWRKREQFLKQYKGQWIAVEDGKVVASGDDLFEVTDEVGKLGCHAYIARVGKEDSLVSSILLTSWVSAGVC